MAKDLVLTIDERRLSNLRVLEGLEARTALAQVWGADVEDLTYYHAVFFDKSKKTLGEHDSFISLTSSKHGYVYNVREMVDVPKAQQQIQTDLDIMNRESQWTSEESIYFDSWWPQPQFNRSNYVLEFGVSLRDFYSNVFNKTLNRIFLTRYGHYLLNYSLSEDDVQNNKELAYFQRNLDEVSNAVSVAVGYRYQDVDVDNDMPSRSKLINLLLSSEIF